METLSWRLQKDELFSTSKEGNVIKNAIQKSMQFESKLEMVRQNLQILRITHFRVQVNVILMNMKVQSLT